MLILATVIVILNHLRWLAFFEDKFSSSTFVHLTIVGPFVPVRLMMAYRLYWADLDLYYRKLEPWAGMDEPSPAESNILLDYPYQLLPKIIINAPHRKHWRTGLASLLGLFSTLPPIVAAGIVTVRTDTNLKSWTAHVGIINFI